MLIDIPFSRRELWEVKQQREELTRELVRKDAQVKEMQQRLESGEGCKFSHYILPPLTSAFLFLSFGFYLFFFDAPQLPCPAPPLLLRHLDPFCPFQAPVLVSK